MRAPDDLFSALAPSRGEARDPKPAARDPERMVRQNMRRAPPKRFYQTASVGETTGGYALLLDRRPARTPGKNLLALPTRAAAERLAAEWQAAGEFIDPATMPVTRILNAALDGVAREIAAVQDEIIKYAGSDLVCYRAGAPAALVAAQTAAWDPVINFACEVFGAQLVLAEGVVFVGQPPPALAALSAAVRAFAEPVPLACLHVLTTLAGSALLALSVAHRRFTVEAAWAAAHVDEDFQARAWGADAEAQTRRTSRWLDFSAAATLLGSLSDEM